MRWLLIFVLVIAAFLGAAWWGGESWLASRASMAIAQRDDVSAAAVSPLRQLDRAGLRIEQAEYQGVVEGQALSVALPWVEFWARPLAPTTLNARLPDQARLGIDGTALDLRMDAVQASLHLSPLNSMAVTQAGLDAAEITLDGQAAVTGLSAEARLASLGYDAPRGAGAAYDIALRLQALEPAALTVLGVPPLAVPGAVSAQGDLRLWLTAAPGRGILRGQHYPVQPVGFRTDGIDLGLGDLRARLVGLVSADAQGRAEGRLALYTSDSRAWLRAASDAGLIPPSAVLLGGAMLHGLSNTPMTPEAAPDDSSRTARIASEFHSVTEFIFPEPAPGELRIPIFLRDGQAFLGKIPIGPAPSFLGG